MAQQSRWCSERRTRRTSSIPKRILRSVCDRPTWEQYRGYVPQSAMDEGSSNCSVRRDWSSLCSDCRWSIEVCSIGSLYPRPAFSLFASFGSGEIEIRCSSTYGFIVKGGNGLCSIKLLDTRNDNEFSRAKFVPQIEMCFSVLRR